MGNNDRAIIVGINRYPELGDLQGPENDALEFRDWLLDPQGGDVPDANIAKILSSEFPAAAAARAQPTTEAFKAAVDELHTLGLDNGGRAGDRLYLFFAGHGFAPDLEDSALLMANAAAKRTGHHIPGRPYANWFRTSAFFKEVVLFMDCCRENYARAAKQPCHLDAIYAQVPARYFYGFATKWSRATRERPTTDRTVRGLFTTALVEGLKKARDPSGQLTGKQLRPYVVSWLDRNAPDRPADPEFFFDEDEDIVFAQGSPPRFTVRITIRTGDVGRSVRLLAGDLSEISPASRDGAAWEWKLSNVGIYKYRVDSDPGTYLEISGDREMLDVEV